jgi:carbon-monoxide dehydrogenase iron sulfur subunit
MTRRIFCDLTLCLGCRSCEIACVVEHSKSKDLFKAAGGKEVTYKRVKVGSSGEAPFPVRCQHCAEAACVTACMSGAMYKDKDGRTAHDKEKCVGCWMCIMACPFGAITKDDRKKVVFKCDLCPDREVPACVEACPTKALFIGTAREFEKKISKKGKTERGETFASRHNRK